MGNSVEPPQTKPRELLNFVTATASILGAAIFFWIGWAYEVNWYSHFGVNIVQIKIPLEQVFVQSIPTVLYLSIVNSSALLIYLLLKALLSYFLLKNNRQANNQFVGKVLVGFKFGLTFGLVDIPLFMSFFVLFFVFTTFIRAFFFFQEIGTVFPIEFGFLIFLPTVPVYIYLYLLMAKKSVSDLSSLWLFLYVGTILMLSVSNSAYLGVTDAANGGRGYTGNWKLQKVYISNSRSMTNMKSLEVYCDKENYCLYGPFAMIGENETSYFFVKWKKEKQNYFPRNPGLYILPREELAIIPADDFSLPDVVSSESPPTTLFATQTATITTTARPILTPIISSTQIAP
jgi:hypothetical protein